MTVVLLALLGWLLAVNASVRAMGGAPGLLQVSHLIHRQEALVELGWHGLRWITGSVYEGSNEPAVRAAARQAGVPVSLAIAMARVESGMHCYRISATGAMGLMQLMPGTAAELGVSDAFDARHNAAGGTQYLAKLLKRYGGDTRRAVAAYNAGPGRVSRRGVMRLPAETRQYVRRVMALYRAAGGGPVAAAGGRGR